MSLESHVTQVTLVAELNSHLQAWPCCQDSCACPGWGKMLALTLYLLALCDRGIKLATQPGPSSNSISGSSMLLGWQSGQILNNEQVCEGDWVINGEQELRYQAQQAILS